MPQKTNLNVSPYYDDFDPDKNFYRVLFKPGYPIQARELTTLQSSFQNQLESFGSNIFKEGSVVIPGAVNYDPFYYSVKINSQNLGIDVSVYIDSLIGKKVRGRVSGVLATIVNYSLISTENNINNITLYVKYLDSGEDNLGSSFVDGEALLAEESFVYGNTTIDVNESVATLITANACYVGSSVSVNDGVYFIRGTFVDVKKDTLILDPYSNTPSYRIGFNIIEEIVGAKEDSSLYDNAKGFTNFAAPGADRLKIFTILTKKLLNDFDDKNFVEILRVDNGVIKRNDTNTPQYNVLKDYIAKRTFEESGDYALDGLRVNIANSLNDGISNAGLFSQNQLTEQGNTPNDDLMCVKVSPGKAYVKGYDIDKPSTSIVDVFKPRAVETTDNVLVPFELGTIIKVNNVSGTPNVGIANNFNIISLMNRRSNSNTVSTGTTIGQARVYSFGLENSPYQNDFSSWNLYCFDVQTFTVLTVNQSLTNAQCPRTSYIKGVSSGASGYAVFSGNSSTEITLTQTSGTFIKGEQILINDSTIVSRSISSIKEYGVQDIKSVFQNSSNFPGLSTSFAADTVLKRVLPNQFSLTDRITVNSSGLVSCPGRSFVGIKSDSIIRYQVSGLTTETYNRVVSVSEDGRTMNVTGVTSIFGVCDGGVPTSTQSVTFSLGIPELKENDSSSLYTVLPNKDVSQVNLSESNLEITAQVKERSTSAAGALSVSISNLGITSAFFNTFDTQRYSIFYQDGNIETLTSDQFTLSSNGTTVNFTGLRTNQSNVTVNLSVKKYLVKNKVKNYIRSEKIIIDRSVLGVSTSVSGLTTSPYYGLRVSDEQISLNYPDVVKVVKIFESLNAGNPVLDKLVFSSGLNLDTSSVLGEQIYGESSKAVAQIVTRSSSSELEICYLNSNTFIEGEEVFFRESNIRTNIQAISPGTYLDITNNFVLDQGQRQQYYDYSRIIRKPSAPVPSRKLMIIFDRYDVPSSDTGDLFTVNSYPSNKFGDGIPLLPLNVRCTDVLDFRPRVEVFSGYNQSPFAYDARNFGNTPSNTNLVVTPNESSILSYSYYLPRIDKVVLNKDGFFNVIIGTPSLNPKEPTDVNDSMTIAVINLPAYLYDPNDATITTIDNRRYSMRDIGSLEKRISNLEKVTSLSLLELDTKTLQIQDADGLSRFKTGFFVDDFKNKSLIDLQNIDVKCDIDIVNEELVPQTDIFTMKPEISFADSVDKSTADFSDDLPLLDSNTVKKGDLVSLKYEEVGWIEQPLASRVENVNPFNIIDFSGSVFLTPSSDNWVRSVYTNGGQRTISGDSDYTYVETLQTSSANDTYIRSRNVYFYAASLRPFTRFYPFFDSVSGIDIVPKLLEISMTSGVFQVGETVHGYVGSDLVIKFRVCQPNHKTGTYNAPSRITSYSPYDRTFIVPSQYSTSSTLLNVDLISLAEQAQGQYGGYVTLNTRLVGTTSNAQANITNLRLISDGLGDVGGAIFFRNPLSSPPPLLRFTTGTKTFRISSSNTNDTQLPGQLSISSAENTYTTSGVVNTFTQTTVVVRRPPPPPPPVIIQPIVQQITVVQQTVVRQTIINNPPPPPPPPPPPKRCGKGGKDPLAQTFTVDETGAFLTSVDLYFAKKDPKERVYVEIRTVEVGTPTKNVVQDFSIAALDPGQVAISSDASAVTNVKFPSPIYLQPDTEYALVILAPTTDNYEVWIGKMGEPTIESRNLPSAENLIVNKQYIGGGLFKSQNGSIWTADQTQDLKFKLYKAKFAQSGTVFLNNPPLGPEYESLFEYKSIKTLPRKLEVGITTTYNMNSILGSSGVKVSDGSSTGNVENVGGPISTVGINNAGIGYSNGSFSNVPLYNITGNGVGAIANVTFTNNKLTSITSIAATGSGYSPGDILGISTSSVVRGSDASISVASINGIDKLYLTNVQGESFGVGSTLRYFSGNTVISLANTSILSSVLTNELYDGSVMEITHFNHGMHSDLNRLKIVNINPDTVPTTLTASLGLSDTTISIANTSLFSTFEGITTSRGFIKINSEIIFYNSIGNGTLGIATRGVDSTLIRTHDLNSPVYKYELNGVSLRRINTTFDMPTTTQLKNLRDIDKYHVKINRSDRSTGSSQLSFADTKSIDNSNIGITENVQFNSVLPRLNVITPSQDTLVNATIKTVSATSSGGSEVSFVEQDSELVQLNKNNTLPSTRMVCSEINEKNRLNSKKSFTMAVNLSTSDTNLSPVIDLQNSAFIFGRSRLNNPIKNYVYDNRVNLLSGDPHAGIYVSKKITLSQPATSLQVLLTAYRHSSSDFRVLYRLFRSDSSEINPSYVLFPGYDNLQDTNNDGFGDLVIDPAKNSGKPDTFVRASNKDEFLEYQFSADNLEQFTGFIIKIVMSGTNEAYPPRFKDLRVVALA